MANVNIEFDGKIYSVDEATLAPLASPLERALIQQLAGTGAVIRFNGTNYDVDADKLASARNVLTDHLGTVEGTDSKVTVNGTEYGLSKTKLQGATDRMSETLGSIAVKPSEGLSYTLNEDGASYSVTGIGTCTDTDLVIPAEYEELPVTGIGSYAFRSCSNLTSVLIPNSVTSIGSQAFYSCTGLTSVTIPYSVESIGSGAFEGCSGLTSVYYDGDIAKWCNISFGSSYATPIYYAKNLYIKKAGTNEYELLTNLVIPDSVTEIKDYAFYNCDSLTSVTIGNGVTSIGDRAFYGCDRLTSVTIPNSVKSIGEDAFYSCDRLKSVYITDIASWCNISFDGEYANPVKYAKKLYIKKSGTNEYELLSNLIIPDSVTKIKDYAFYQCDSLTSVTIPNSVKSIGEDAFAWCDSLTSVTIGNGVTSIGSYAFSGCDSLSSVYYDGDIASWCNISFASSPSISGPSASPLSNGAELYIKNTLGEYELLTNLVIPDSVTKLKDSAFSGCTSLTSVTIGDSVTSIGYSAFRSCSNLTSITIPDSVTSIGSSAFYNTAYYKNELNWENGVLYIGKYLIGTKIDIPGAYTVKEGTKLIASYAFNDCDSLTSITIPNSVTSIGSYAFSFCSSLTSVYITDIASWCNISFDGSNANPLSYAKNLYLNGTLVTDLEIPNSITSIGYYAFYSCDSLTSVTIPDSVTSIGSYAFLSCTGLTSIYINKKKGSVSGSPWGANNATVHWNSTGPDAA